PITLPGTNVIMSDAVIASFQSPGLVELVSDGDPQLAQLAAALAIPGLLPNVSVLEETGSLQDLTNRVGSGIVGLQVQVQSDVVPEPATFALLGLGLLGLATQGRRRS